LFKGCAQNEIRTRTSLRMPPPQDGASTNFATWALKRCENLSILTPQFSYLKRRARRETRTLKRQFSTASETATFTNFAIRAYHFINKRANIIVSGKLQLNKLKNQYYVV
jgi:hypothetical protein